VSAAPGEDEIMCRRVTCSTCGKPDWAGCGAHVEQVLGNVPKDQRCRCREQGKSETKAAGPFDAISSWFGGKPSR
jgi:hypothetical protein